MLPIESWRTAFDERYPIYQQIINRFSHALVRGEIGPGERIPSIRELALTLKVNTNTIQRAYQEMERDGVIYSQRGTGYFIMDNNDMVSRVTNNMVSETSARYLSEMRAMGFQDGQIIDKLQQEMQKEALSDDAADN